MTSIFDDINNCECIISSLCMEHTTQENEYAYLDTLKQMLPILSQVYNRLDQSMLVVMNLFDEYELPIIEHAIDNVKRKKYVYENSF